MQTMNVSLPEPMRKFVEEEVVKGGYSTISEYIRAILREEQKKQGQEKLETLLLEGLGSGSPSEMTKSYQDGIRREARLRLKAKK